MKKENLGRYFIAGIIVAAILFFIFSSINDEDKDNSNIHVWSAEMDSAFVKNCYSKYKPQVKDDLNKQENSKTFCRCMLEKIKTKYDEKDMGQVTDDEIKTWDAECRNKIINNNKN